MLGPFWGHCGVGLGDPVRVVAPACASPRPPHLPEQNPKGVDVGGLAQLAALQQLGGLWGGRASRAGPGRVNKLGLL